MRIPPFLCAAIIGCTLLLPGQSHAGAQWGLDINLASIHTEKWARHQLNQANLGVGVTWQRDRAWAITGGVYRNSYSRATWYALAEYTPLQIGWSDSWHLDVGVAGGLASGYRSAEVPSAPAVAAGVIKIASPAGVGVNILGIPNTGHRNSGFVGFQLTFSL